MLGGLTPPNKLSTKSLACWPESCPVFFFGKNFSGSEVILSNPCCNVSAFFAFLAPPIPSMPPAVVINCFPSFRLVMSPNVPSATPLIPILSSARLEVRFPLLDIFISSPANSAALTLSFRLKISSTNSF